MEMKAKECRELSQHVKDKRMAVLKLTASSAKVNKKEDFEKMVAAIKTAKEEVESFQATFKDHCPIGGKKAEAKKMEAKSAEVKKEEPKKEEPKKEEKKEEVKKEEVKPTEVKKEEPKAEEKKPEEIKK